MTASALLRASVSPLLQTGSFGESALPSQPLQRRWCLLWRRGKTLHASAKGWASEPITCRESLRMEVADCGHVKTYLQAPGQPPLQSGVSFPSPQAQSLVALFQWLERRWGFSVWPCVMFEIGVWKPLELPLAPSLRSATWPTARCWGRPSFSVERPTWWRAESSCPKPHVCTSLDVKPRAHQAWATTAPANSLTETWRESPRHSHLSRLSDLQTL